jgi:GAF domain-containing protein
MTMQTERAAQDASLGQPSRDYAGEAAVNELAETLSELARLLEGEQSLEATLDGITHAAVRTVPGTRYAGITEVQGRRRMSTRAPTAEVVVAADQAQYDTGEGPCLAAIAEHETVRVTDVNTETRWPAFTRRARELGVGAMLSFRLYVSGDNLGALNLYAERADAFTDESEYIGLLFASHAAVAMVGARREQSKDRALLMRDLIGQAKGILMERHRITADEAFGLLVGASQRTNLKLTEIARRLTESGELPRRS